MKLETFEAYRPLLFSIAYRMLGTASDAEDILQDAYLRVMKQVDDDIENPKTYLATIVTRLCLNELAAARSSREEYLGPWLPEPIPTDEIPLLDIPGESMIQHDTISIAFLVLLESLSPAERAVFLLHEVFGYRHPEIAEILEKTEAASRQLLRRARAHIEANKPRFTASPEDHDRLLRSFIEVVEGGEIERFLSALAEDVTLIPDGGGTRGAAIRVLKGREAVSAFIIGTRQFRPMGLKFELVNLNGQKSILARAPDGSPYFVIFAYGDGRSLNLIHVIAGRKLRAIPA
ncbi:MAG TPA: RNA polymerase sigma factor SigJ [Anaerolineales bacterium]|nr:RNA polymerase sigma factor SigJ [Anaerolineales bacterium]